MLLVLVGVVAAVIYLQWAWLPMLVGGLLLFCCRMSVRLRRKDDSVVLRRRNGLLMLSMVALCFSAWLLYVHKGYWLLPLLFTAVVELYTAFRQK